MRCSLLHTESQRQHTFFRISYHRVTLMRSLECMYHQASRVGDSRLSVRACVKVRLVRKLRQKSVVPLLEWFEEGGGERGHITCKPSLQPVSACANAQRVHFTSWATIVDGDTRKNLALFWMFSLSITLPTSDRYVMVRSRSASTQLVVAYQCELDQYLLVLQLMQKPLLYTES